MSPALVKRRTVADIGEFGFLARLLPTLPSGRGVVVGPGDDCAVVATGARRLLVTTDALVEHVHFRRTWMTPAQIGRKAFLVNASDVAAMGGRPRFCVASVGAPPSFPSADLAAIHRGLAGAAAAAGALVVGGNLTRARELFVSIALLAESPPRPVRRAGARPGDGLYVTGTLGDAALGLRLLRHDPAARGPAVRRFCTPEPRLRAGALLARRALVSAMIDVSDGLLQDLSHLCAASGVGARIALERLPCSAAVRRAGQELVLRGGEDYELLCAVPARCEPHVTKVAAKLGCPFTRIGECRPAREGLRVIDARRRVVAVTTKGHDHFVRRPPR